MQLSLDPQGTAVPPTWSNLSPSSAVTAALACFWGWQPPGQLVTVTYPWPQEALFAKGLMFSR